MTPAELTVIAAQRQIPLTYGRSALSQWITGHIPPPHVRELCAAVLSSKLGRLITADQIWAETATGQALDIDPSLPGSVRLLEILAREDVNRRDALISAGYVVGAAVMPAWRRLFLPDLNSAAPARSARRVGQRDVERMHEALQRFDRLDHSNGGASARRALAVYLSEQVVPALAAACDRRADRDRFAAAALLTRKAALMASDDNQPGRAQAYFAQALHLAKASGDRALGAHVLVSMSHQATDAGDPVTAAGLADAARTGTGKAAPPSLQAKIALMQARADARMGYRRDCLRQIGRVLESFTATRPVPWWAANITNGYLHRQIAYCHLDLPAVRARHRSASRVAERAPWPGMAHPRWALSRL